MNRHFIYPAPRAVQPVASDRSLEPNARFSRVAATAIALPGQNVTNQEIIANHGHSVSASAMARIVGVSQRRVAPSGVTDSDLLLQAAERCLARAGMRPDDLTKILVTKFLGDRILPMTACSLQKKLRCATAVQAYDIDGGIHAFILALDAANCFIATGDGPVLIASGGVINRLVSREDPRVAFQYGDGAAAVLLVPSTDRHLLSSYSFTNYDYVNNAVGVAARSLVPRLDTPNIGFDSFFDLYEHDGGQTAKTFVLEAMKHTVTQLLDTAGKAWADVDLFLITETYHRLRLAIIERLGIEPHRTLSILSNYGNTMSAMLPMQLEEAIRVGAVGDGSLVMLLSIGEGVSGGGSLLRL